MDGKLVIGTELNTKMIDKQIDLLQDKLEGLLEEYEILEKDNKLGKNNEQLIKLGKEIDTTRNKLSKLVAEKENMGKFDISKMLNGLSSIVKKTIQWGLAIFSVRSTYMAVRRAVSVVTQGNEELANKIQYISYAFSMLLEPVIIRVVNFIYTLMSYIDYIAQKWFNLEKSIFKSAKDMQKVNKSANELRKTLSGFDEMNILGDNVSGGGSNAFTPEVAKITNDNAWGPIKWIANNKNKVLEILSAITGGLITLKLVGLNPIAAILGAIIGLELYTLLKNILTMIKNPSWAAFGEILENLGVIIATISALLMVLGVASGPIGWIIFAVGLLTSSIGNLIKKLEKNKSAIKNVKEANEDLKKAKEDLYDATENYTQAVKNEEQAHKDLIEAQNETGLSGKELYDLVDSGKIKYKNLNEQQRKVYDAYVNEQKAIGNVKIAEENLIETRKAETQASIESELANAKETNSYNKLKESIVKAFRDGKISAGEARDYLSRAMGDMSKDSKQTFMKDIPNDIKAGLDPHQYDSWGTKLKNWWNKLINGLDTTIELYGVSHGGGGGGSKGSSQQKGLGRAKGGIYYPSKLPRLAVGGIINQPGRGVPYHGAYIGERGAEAVVPLTDSQQMALLGETIGRYVNIQANIPVYVGNRMVAREIKRINAEDDFAFNR